MYIFCINNIFDGACKAISDFKDLDVYVVMIPIFPTNQEKCAIFSRSVAILILLSKKKLLHNMHFIQKDIHSLFDETGRRQGDSLREQLRDIERNDKDAYKPVARRHNLPNHSSQHMTVYGLSLPARVTWKAVKI